MNSGVGLLGAFVLAIGGTILFEEQYVLQYVILEMMNIGPTSFVSVFISFIGFFLVGLGLWFIVLSGKPDNE